MQSKTLLTATLLLGTLAVSAEPQDPDLSTVHWRGGRPLKKELAGIPDDAVPLLLAIDVPGGAILAGENFPMRFVVTNPNTMALRFPGTGWTRPRLYASTGHEELGLFVDRSFGVNVGEIGGLTLAPGESAEITVTKVFPRTGAIAQHLYAEIGYTLRLRGAGAVKTVAVEEPGCAQVVCKWESEEIQIPVRAPTTRERRAYQAIADWNETHRVTAPGLSQEQWTLSSVDFRRKFLDEYGDTPYANQVRVLLLRDLVRLPRQRSGNDTEKLPPFFPLYVKTVSELLDAGVPYASKVDRGVLEALAIAGRWDLVVDALDKLLAINPLERTLDQTFTRFSHEFVDFPRLQAKGYLSEGKETEDLEAVAVRCIERCTGWTGYRAVPFDRRTFAFLSEIRRWNLLELAAQRTLDVSSAGQDCGTRGPSSQSKVSDETIAAAREALNLASRKHDKQP